MYSRNLGPACPQEYYLSCTTLVYVHTRTEYGVRSSSCFFAGNIAQLCIAVHIRSTYEKFENTSSQECGLTTLSQPRSYLGCFMGPPPSSGGLVLRPVRQARERRSRMLKPMAYHGGTPPFRLTYLDVLRRSFSHRDAIRTGQLHHAACQSHVFGAIRGRFHAAIALPLLLAGPRP